MHYFTRKLELVSNILWVSVDLILIIYDYLFVVITTRFYRNTYNYKVEQKSNELKQLILWICLQYFVHDSTIENLRDGNRENDDILQGNHRSCFMKKDVLKNLKKLRGKNLFESLFF